MLEPVQEEQGREPRLGRAGALRLGFPGLSGGLVQLGRKEGRGAWGSDAQERPFKAGPILWW
jgi:hypothetical protein